VENAEDEPGRPAHLDPLPQKLQGRLLEQVLGVIRGNAEAAHGIAEQAGPRCRIHENRLHDFAGAACGVGFAHVSAGVQWTEILGIILSFS
jgi:hypothetical protein